MHDPRKNPVTVVYDRKGRIARAFDMQGTIVAEYAITRDPSDEPTGDVQIIDQQMPLWMAVGVLLCLGFLALVVLYFAAHVAWFFIR